MLERWLWLHVLKFRRRACSIINTGNTDGGTELHTKSKKASCAEAAMGFPISLHAAALCSSRYERHYLYLTAFKTTFAQCRNYFCPPILFFIIDLLKVSCTDFVYTSLQFLSFLLGLVPKTGLFSYFPALGERKEFETKNYIAEFLNEFLFDNVWVKHLAPVTCYSSFISITFSTHTSLQVSHSV